MKFHMWTLVLLLCPCGTASLFAQTADRPIAKIFGFLPTQPAATESAAPPLEDNNRLSEILVELAWLNDPLTFPYYLEARVVGPNLKVFGNVPSKAARERALELAKANCPLPLDDRLKVNTNLSFHPTHASVDQLQNLARACLREALPARARSLLTRSSADGRVAVVGTVPSYEEKLAVSRALRRLRSCTVAVNLVKVAADPDGLVARSMVQGPPPTVAAVLPATPTPALIPPDATLQTQPIEQVTPQDVNPLTVDAASSTPPPGVQPALPIIADRPPTAQQMVPDAGMTPTAAPVAQPAPPATSSKIDVRRLDLVQLKKRLEPLCPNAEVNVSIAPDGKLKVVVHAKSLDEGSKMCERILNLPEFSELSVAQKMDLEAIE